MDREKLSGIVSVKTKQLLGQLFSQEEVLLSYPIHLDHFEVRVFFCCCNFQLPYSIPRTFNVGAPPPHFFYNNTSYTFLY